MSANDIVIFDKGSGFWTFHVVNRAPGNVYAYMPYNNANYLHLHRVSAPGQD